MEQAAGFPPRDRKILVGMVHVLPLPGSPRWAGSMASVIERARRDGGALAAAGFDAVLFENFGDTPFFPERVPAETVAALTAVVAAIAPELRLPFGVNVLRNDAAAALGIAAATGASFVRVNVHTGALLTDQGWIRGRAEETLRLRRLLQADVAVCADVLVKHAMAPPGADPAEVARDTHRRGRADVLIVSGPATGSPADPARLRTVRAAVPEAPLWIGSGIHPDSVAACFELADGAIVGSSLKPDNDPDRAVDPARAAALVRAARA